MDATLKGLMMPCPACNRTYLLPPCKHETGILCSKDMYSKVTFDDIPEIFKQSFAYCTIVFQIEVYKALHYNCPCKNCLVKATCDVEYTKRCSEYIDLIDYYYNLYYDEINGTFSKTVVKGRW